MDILVFKYNYTTKFILPLLFKDFPDYNKLFKEPFIDAYIADMANKNNDDKIHLLFADYPSLAFQQLLPKPLSEYKRKEGYVFIYDIPNKYKYDYLKFLVGDYSKFTEDAKTKILSFWQAESDTILKGVLYKKGNKIKNFYKKSLDVNLDEFAPSAEWWAQPNIEQEILGLS